MARKICISFVDFEKTIRYIHRASLWTMLRACGTLTHIVDHIKLFYESNACTIKQSDIIVMVVRSEAMLCDVSSLIQPCHKVDYEEDNRRTSKRTAEGPVREQQKDQQKDNRRTSKRTTEGPSRRQQKDQ